MNQAVLYWISSMRCSWWLLMPFLDEHSRWMACNHLCSGTWLYSKIVPTRTVNCLRQCAALLQAVALDAFRALLARLGPNAL